MKRVIRPAMDDRIAGQPQPGGAVADAWQGGDLRYRRQIRARYIDKHITGVDRRQVTAVGGRGAASAGQRTQRHRAEQPADQRHRHHRAPRTPARRPPPVPRRSHRESAPRAAGQACPHARHCAPDSTSRQEGSHHRSPGSQHHHRPCPRPAAPRPGPPRMIWAPGPGQQPALVQPDPMNPGSRPHGPSVRLYGCRATAKAEKPSRMRQRHVQNWEFGHTRLRQLLQREVAHTRQGGAKRTTLAPPELSRSVHAFAPGSWLAGTLPDCRPPDRYRCGPWLFQDRFDRHLTVVPGVACAA